MTKKDSKSALLSISYAINDASKKAGHAYISDTDKFKQMVESINTAAADSIIAEYDRTFGAHIEAIRAKSTEAESLIELFIFIVIFNTPISNKKARELLQELLLELINFKKTFTTMAQNRAILALPALNKNELSIDLSGTASAEINGVSFTLCDYISQASKLCAQLYYLNDALLIKYAQTHSQTIELPLREYAEMRGLSGSKDQLRRLRQEVASLLPVLASIEYRCREKIGGKYVDSGIVRINGGTAIIHRGVIRWNFNADIIASLDRFAPMDYSVDTLKADPRTSQYFFSRYIDENYRLNRGSARLSTISVKTLLSKTPNIPKYSDVKANRGSPKQKIIVPFFRDLDALERVYYDVIDENGNRIDDFNTLDYKTFIGCSIQVDYSEYGSARARKQTRRKQTLT